MEDPGQAGERHNQDSVITVGPLLAAGSKPGAPISRNKSSPQVQAFILVGKFWKARCASERPTSEIFPSLLLHINFLLHINTLLFVFSNKWTNPLLATHPFPFLVPLLPFTVKIWKLNTVDVSTGWLTLTHSTCASVPSMPLKLLLSRSPITSMFPKPVVILVPIWLDLLDPSRHSWFLPLPSNTFFSCLLFLLLHRQFLSPLLALLSLDPEALVYPRVNPESLLFLFHTLKSLSNLNADDFQLYDFILFFHLAV